MPILSSTQDLAKHVTVAKSFTFSSLEPYIEDAVYEFTQKYVGDLHISLADEDNTENAAIRNQGRHILQRVLTNFSFFLYVPLGSVFMDSSGFSNADNEQRKALEWHQVKDLQRKFLSAGHKAMDRLLGYLEKNKAAFPEWANSTQYTESKELLVNNAETFSKYYNIFDSRMTYLALQPMLRKAEDKNLKTFLCTELITHLKTTDVTGVKQEVKQALQKALVAFTVATVCEEGLFIIDATGLKMKLDVLSTDKALPVDWDFLNKTAKTQVTDGQNYLMTAKQLIEENPAQFTQCAQPIKTTTGAGSWTPYNTQSIVGL